MEGRSGQVWDEFVVAEVVVVTEVAIETCDIGNEGFPVLFTKVGESGVDAICHKRVELGDGRQRRQVYPHLSHISFRNYARTNH